MKCPDCGNDLAGASVLGTDESFRCSGCGGVWLRPEVVNRVANGEEVLIAPAGLNPGRGGEGMCPQDGETRLIRPEDRPEGVSCWRCGKCGWWWFGEDELIKFGQAWEAKRNYYKVWHRLKAVPAWVLPVLSLVVLVGGLFGAASLAQRRQAVTSRAKEEVIVRWFAASDLGGGKVEVTFGASGGGVGAIQYKKIGEESFRTAAVSLQGNQYVGQISGLEGGRYEVSIAGILYEFEVK